VPKYACSGWAPHDARPVGVRWAAPIACAGSVQAVAKRQRCLRHRWIKSRQRRESAHPNNTAGGHNTTRGHRHTGPEPTAGGGSKRSPQGGTTPQVGGPPGGHNTAGGTSTHKGAAPTCQHLVSRFLFQGFCKGFFSFFF